MTRSSLARTISNAMRLPQRRWWGVLSTIALASYVEAGLRLSSLPRVAQSLGVPLATSSETPLTPSNAAPLYRREVESIDMIRRVLRRRPFNGTCLRQSLLVGHALRSRQPKLRLGVNKAASTVTAHAWVEVEGFVIDDYRMTTGTPPNLHLLDPVKDGSPSNGPRP